jgi:hypothetical protein
MITNYKCTFGFKESKNTSVTQKQMSSQREQYGSTVHLFIGTGRSSCKITRFVIVPGRRKEYQVCATFLTAMTKDFAMTVVLPPYEDMVAS